MSINVWIAQPEELKAEVAALKLEASSVAELAVEGEIKGGRGRISPKEIKGTKEEKEDYVRLSAKIADKTDGLFRAPTIKGAALSMESLYVDTVDEIAALEKGGATILGAWNWDGSRIKEYDLHPNFIDFMPIRTVDLEEALPEDRRGGEDLFAELEPILEDVVLVWGQNPREFA